MQSGEFLVMVAWCSVQNEPKSATFKAKGNAKFEASLPI